MTSPFFVVEHVAKHDVLFVSNVLLSAVNSHLWSASWSCMLRKGLSAAPTQACLFSICSTTTCRLSWCLPSPWRATSVVVNIRNQFGRASNYIGLVGLSGQNPFQIIYVLAIWRRGWKCGGHNVYSNTLTCQPNRPTVGKYIAGPPHPCANVARCGTPWHTSQFICQNWWGDLSPLLCTCRPS